MGKLTLKIPPVFVWVLIALLGAAINQRFVNFSVNFPNNMFVSCVLFLVAVIIGLLGVFEFKKHKTSVHPVDLSRAKNIVTSGVFGYSRNPMYLALAVTLISTSIIQSSVVFVITVPMFVVYMNEFQIKAEEAFLTEKFGEEFKQYMKSVRRWI
jgi:protein-S-isoprenylcysteine O-methyltransferase Ste14